MNAFVTPPSSRIGQLPRSLVLRRLLGIGPALGFIGLFMLVPMLIVLAFSFMEADSTGGVLPHFSTEAYVQLLFERDLDDTLVFDDTYLIIIGRSLGLSVLTTLWCLIASFPVAYYLTQQTTRRRQLLLLLITIPFWTNLLVRTYAWILILGENGVIEQPLTALGWLDSSLGMMYTNGAVTLGLVYSYLPLMVLPIYASLEKLDFRLLEAASDLYAGRWALLREIVLPLCWPGIVAGCLLVFVPSLGAFVSPDLLGGGKKLMLGNLIQMQFSASRNWPLGSAIAMLLMAITMLALLLRTRSAKRPALEAAT